MSTVGSMEEALTRLASTSEEFDINLLDQVVAAAYDPVNPQRAGANKVLMTLQENPDIWMKADAILEKASNPQSRFFGLQILDDAIRTR